MTTARGLIFSVFDGPRKTTLVDALTAIKKQGLELDDQTIKDHLKPWALLSDAEYIQYAFEKSAFSEQFQRVCKDVSATVFKEASQGGPEVIKYLAERSILSNRFDINTQINWTLNNNPSQVYTYTENCPLTMKYLLFECPDKEKIVLKEKTAIDIAHKVPQVIKQNRQLNPTLVEQYKKLTSSYIDENVPVEEYITGYYSYRRDGSWTNYTLEESGAASTSDGGGGALGSESTESTGTWKIESVDKEKHIATVKFSFTSTTSSSEVGFNDTSDSVSDRGFEQTVTIHYAKKPKELRSSSYVCKQL